MQSLNTRRQKGLNAEARAVRWLRAKGWQIICRNRRLAQVEVDIIALHLHLGERTYAFIEVKRIGSPEAQTFYPAVTISQRRRYRTAMLAFQQEIGHHLATYMAVLLVDNNQKIVEFYPVV